jgi:hypothetical protein
VVPVFKYQGSTRDGSISNVNHNVNNRDTPVSKDSFKSMAKNFALLLSIQKEEDEEDEEELLANDDDSPHDVEEDSADCENEQEK